MSFNDRCYICNDRVRPLGNRVVDTYIVRWAEYGNKQNIVAGPFESYVLAQIELNKMRENKGPVYQHDCDACQYLATGKYNSEVCDFYVCEQGSVLETRSFIARYGNDGPEYSSCPLFCCVELTPLDKFALYYGLELTATEKEKLLKVLLNNVYDKQMNYRFHKDVLGNNPDFMLGKENHFGKGI